MSTKAAVSPNPSALPLEAYPLQNQTDRTLTEKRHGPWRCTTCGGYSWTVYRCDAIVGHRDGEPILCRADLATGGGSSGISSTPTA